ncbi:unnamed protein product [Symbiodinium natans]|uniref:Uncharacterized protein n=1 Tax=Symbiodinium natans TaxID=878477 RepID=A0A812J4W6_9DINO|nr:unnamed protein product [Symbiodinium natans]
MGEQQVKRHGVILFILLAAIRVILRSLDKSKYKANAINSSQCGQGFQQHSELVLAKHLASMVASGTIHFWQQQSIHTKASYNGDNMLVTLEKGNDASSDDRNMHNRTQ